MTYAYDDLNRLTQEEKKAVDETVLYSMTYTYDPAGNRLSKTDQNDVTVEYTYDAANRIQTAGSAVYTFDDNGNMTGKTIGEDTTTYAYNSENRMTGATLPSSTTTFGYAPSGMRNSKVTGTGTTNYLTSGLDTIRETDGNNAVIADYTTDPSRLVGQVISRTDGEDNTAYYGYDGSGSTSNTTDIDQTQTSSYSYDAFGNIINQTGQNATYTFSTKELDGTGFYYFAARYYDPTTGRFTTVDPAPANLFDPQSLNRYVYCRNSPANYVDPLGLWYEDINLSGGYWGGFTGGVMIDWERGEFYPYLGGGFVSPKAGGAITWNPGHPTPGWNAAMAFQFGVAYQRGYSVKYKCGNLKLENPYNEWGVGGNWPELGGGQITGFYVWKI
jgi:RHS repeat-associated protein